MRPDTEQARSRFDPDAPLPRVMRLWQVAAVLDVSEDTVRKACKAGDIPCIALGSVLRVPGPAFEKWLEER